MAGYGGEPTATATPSKADAEKEHFTDAELPAFLLSRAQAVADRLAAQNAGRKSGEIIHFLQHRLPHLWPHHSHSHSKDKKSASAVAAPAAPTPALYAIKPYGGSLASLVDHTLLKADASGKEVETLCGEAAAHGFAAVCVNPSRVATATKALKPLKNGKKVGVAAVVGFPLGANTAAAKAAEARELVEVLGVTELDMVLNVGALKEKDFAMVLHDIAAVTTAAAKKKRLVKVIFECSLLTPTEMVDASLLSVLGGAAFVKTSTGFGASGAKARDVRLMRLTVGDACGVKASGGIRDIAAARAMVAAGANRIGTSAGVAIAKAESAAAASSAAAPKKSKL